MWKIIREKNKETGNPQLVVLYKGMYDGIATCHREIAKIKKTHCK